MKKYIKSYFVRICTPRFVTIIMKFLNIVIEHKKVRQYLCHLGIEIGNERTIFHA